MRGEYVNLANVRHLRVTRTRHLCSPQYRCSVIPQFLLPPQFASASITGNMNANDLSYNPPLALTVISAISIGIAGLVSLWILLDIIQRKGWRTMMGVM